MRLGLVGLILLGGCRFFTTDDGRVPMARRPNRGQEMPIGVPVGPEGARLLTEGSPRKVDAAIQEGPRLENLPADQPGLVVLVVLDTVRSESMAACGYARPTGTVLQTLTARGAALTCDAYAPATWTIPSHASYFTGLDPAAHGLHRKGVRLRDDIETLAELYTARGYQTVMISANPVLKEETGLQQGFQRVKLSPGLAGTMRGEGFVGALRQELAQVDASRPLFLFLNIFDAHDPYPPIPAGVEGFTEQPAFSHRVGVKSTDNPFFAYHLGQMEPVAAADYARQAREGYDYGVMLADRVLARTLKTLERSGWTDHGARLVVTSDHGENVGEHSRIGHDGPPYETVSRVPFLFWDSRATAPIALPAPFAARNVFELLRDGRLPDPLPSPEAMSFQYGDSDIRFRDAAALWPAPGQKVLWVDGAGQQFGLARDPGEASPGPADPAVVAGLVERHGAVKAQGLGAARDPLIIRALEGLGYVGE
jgi:hypothetical protein